MKTLKSSGIDPDNNKLKQHINHRVKLLFIQTVKMSISLTAAKKILKK